MYYGHKFYVVIDATLSISLSIYIIFNQLMDYLSIFQKESFKNQKF